MSEVRCDAAAEELSRVAALFAAVSFFFFCFIFFSTHGDALRICYRDSVDRTRRTVRRIMLLRRMV